MKKVHRKKGGLKGGRLGWGVMGDQRGMLIMVFKKYGREGRHFELGDDGRSEGNGEQGL